MKYWTLALIFACFSVEAVPAYKIDLRVFYNAENGNKVEEIHGEMVAGLKWSSPSVV